MQSENNHSTLTGKEFSYDWTTQHTAVWKNILLPWQDRDARVLEIGTWEGRTAIFFLTYLPHSIITCIDTFQGTESLLKLPEFSEWVEEIPHSEMRFDRNVAEFGARVEKIKNTSVNALDRLIAQGRTYDIIYVDASHRRDDVTADSIRAWQLLAETGLIIWDDYGWMPHYPASERPKDAIDGFLNAHAGSYVLLEKSYQVIIQKGAGAEPLSLSRNAVGSAQQGNEQARFS